MTFYKTFNKKNHRKKQFCINIYKHQGNIIDELVQNEVYDSRSEFMRIAIEFYLSNEYTQALRKNEKKIINTLKKHNGKKNRERLK